MNILSPSSRFYDVSETNAIFVFEGAIYIRQVYELLIIFSITFFERKDTEDCRIYFNGNIVPSHIKKMFHKKQSYFLLLV